MGFETWVLFTRDFSMVSVQSFLATILRKNLYLAVEEGGPDPEAVESSTPSPGSTGDGIFEFFT